MPNVMVALPNIGGALCSTPQWIDRIAPQHHWLLPINRHFRDCEARCSGSPCKLRYIRIRPLPLPLRIQFEISHEKMITTSPPKECEVLLSLCLYVCLSSDVCQYVLRISRKRLVKTS